MGEAEVSKVKVKGKIIITSDKGQRVEIENPELMVLKKKVEKK